MPGNQKEWVGMQQFLVGLTRRYYSFSVQQAFRLAQKQRLPIMGVGALPLKNNRKLFQDRWRQL